MKLDFTKYTYIGCVPVKDNPTHPYDSLPCKLEQCPMCKNLMWVSEKKKAMEKRNPLKVRALCFRCLIEGMIKSGIDPRDAELIDITKMQ